MIGILGLQGDFAAHGSALDVLGAENRVVKKPEEFDSVQGLIVPGGESTTLLKLMESYDYWGALEAFVESGRPVMGTCAGMILLAREVINPPQASLGFIDITVERNSYGRQRESFEATGRFNPQVDHQANPQNQMAGATTEREDGESVHMVFIRAPRILHMGADVTALATCGDDVVMARQANIVVASFHPELSGDGAVHGYFAGLVG
jgi:5'-phosphate synthase pdxT subunit